MLDHLLDDKRRSLRDEVRDFVKWVPRQMILDMDAEKIRYPRSYLEEAARRNLLGLRFPESLGGRAMNWQDEIVAIEEIGVLGSSLGCLYSLVSIVGEAIYKFGTREQQQKYLKPAIGAALTTAEALTEPRGGSDFFGATTTAKRVGEHYFLNGQKRFIVGAEGADYFLVYARTGESAKPNEGISAFIVERDAGVEVKHLYGLMGTRGGGTGRVFFRDVKIPVENRVGEENEGGKIFYHMMVPERMTSAAGALGAPREALRIAAKYAMKRKAFGTQIRNFEAVSFKIAECITKLDAAEALLQSTARTLDAGASSALCRRLVSESKKFCTETAWEVANHAMQIMGGIGYTNVYPIERVLRDTRLISIWTGTNEIMNLIIQHEFFKEQEADTEARDFEQDAEESGNEEEKIYE